MPPATYPADGSRAASSSCRCCRRRRRPREASHQILIGQLGNRDWYLLSERRSPTPPAADRSPSNQARQKARQPASPRPRTRSSNPVPSSRESTNFRFLRRAIAREEARRSGSRSGKTTPQATTSSSTRRLLPGSKALRRPGTGIEKGDPASRCRPASSARLRPPESAVDESSRASLDTHFRRHSRGRASGPSARFHPR